MGLLLGGFTAQADDSGDKFINCDYKYYGYPFAQVQIYIFPGGEVASSATITNQGKSHKESVTVEPLAAGENLHVWISKENPQNAVEMIAYSEAKAEGDSVLINHNVPISKEVWGNCVSSSAE